jgi:hypothetical protein
MPKLTENTYQAILCTSCSSKVGRGNPFFSIGEKPPLFSVVFLRPSFSTISNGVHFIMTGLFGQPSRLVAPMRGISTPFSSVASDVEIIGFGNPFKHRIHQMKIAKPPARIEQTQMLKKQKTTD